MKINNEFPVEIYGALEKYNDVLSKARVRIFYKYGNRNGTYITDEFADKLISTLAYAPVKGIYEGDDYTDHGTRRDEGRIYGIVPEQFNFAWEEFQDEDGMTRTYACADVLIFTAIYPEANEILGKSQSMELYRPTIKYHEAVIEGKHYAVFDEGCFLGLQVLGDTTEPCFEGAAFYELQPELENVIHKLQALYDIEETQMKVTFKLSDEQKFGAIFDLLNPNFAENWEVEYGIISVYDDYALVLNCAMNRYERVYYTKNDETDTVELGEKVVVYIMDVTGEEKTTLETLRVLNGDTYEAVSETLLDAQENFEKLSAADSRILELDEQVSTLNTEKENYQTQINDVQASLTAANENIETLTGELNSLREFKHTTDISNKNLVIDQYSGLLSASVLEDYRANIENYTADELDMHLAYELKKNGSLSNLQGSGLVPKDEGPKSGLEAILKKYKR